MKEVLKRAAVRLGLEKPGRQVWMALKARGWTPWEPLVPEDAFTSCVSQAVKKLRELEPREEFGDYLEFGVSRGTSLACVHRVLQRENLKQVRLIGFDSFQGMPPGSDVEGWVEGAFYSTQAASRRYLESQGVSFTRVILVEGWFSQTLNPQTRADLKLGKASLIMIDCDIYSASKEALAFCEPHISEHAVIMFDDWGAALKNGTIGQKEAFEEFVEAHPNMRAEPLSAYSENSRVFLVRRPANDK
jgi:O-methyltransferase